MSILQIEDNREEWHWAINYWLKKYKNQPWLVSGGSVVGVLKALKAKPAQIWTSDERFVPKKDEKSNFGALEKAFGKNIFGFNTNVEILECLEDYSSNIPSKIPFAVLGVGPDGHVASLFPAKSGKKVKKSENTFTEIWETDVFDVKERLSVSKKYLIENVETMLLVFAGEKKKPVAEKLRSLSHDEKSWLPVEKIFYKAKGKVICLFGDF